MARPLRVDVEGGWYHVTARGTERRTIYHAKRFYEHFLELLEEMSGRYGVEVHAYCLMKNHYHLILRTPHANASKAIQWLNVSYSAWFNAKMNRVGHVFQGRFSSVLIDGEGSWLLKASVYLHLNPIRTADMGLNKRAEKAEGLGLIQPEREAVEARLENLKQFRWSSYNSYAGYQMSPEWLHTETILERSGGKAGFRRVVQSNVTKGLDPETFECLRGRVAIGAVEFVERVKTLVGKVTKEQPDRKFVQRLVPFERIVEVAEAETGLRWRDCEGGSGYVLRDLVLYLSRKRSGLTLKEIGDLAGGMDYKSVSKAVQRFESKIKPDKDVSRAVARCMAIVET